MALPPCRNLEASADREIWRWSRTQTPSCPTVDVQSVFRSSEAVGRQPRHNKGYRALECVDPFVSV